MHPTNTVLDEELSILIQLNQNLILITKVQLFILSRENQSKYT